jgi:NAD+ synthase (glutamine-hydrolysing)
MFGDDVSAVLRQILDTKISPELVPAGDQAGPQDQPAQRSEDTVGPFELQDFFLYYITRYGLRPGSVAYLARHAWGDLNTGLWPPDLPQEKRNQYSLGEIKRWLGVFLSRFFGSTQFKRSCVPNAPKVGSGGSLSPRGDWRAPSDSVPDTWLAELQANVPDD